MLPATWNPAVLSVTERCQVGWLRGADLHTRDRIVVGDVPITWTRTLMRSPTL